MKSETSHLNVQPVSADEAPMHLLLEADPSEAHIKKYLRQSFCYSAKKNKRFVGVYVLCSLDSSAFELMNIAVAPDCRKEGIGTALLQHAITTAKQHGAERLDLGTGTFGYQLAFYQKAGFRVTAVERDYFLNHYGEPIFEDGIQHKDRLRLSKNL